MKKFRAPHLSLLAFVFVVLLCVPALAQPTLTPKQSLRPSLFTPIADQIQSLINPPSAATTPLGSSLPTAPDTNAADIEPQETFGTRALSLMISEAELLRSEGNTLISNFAALPQLSSWYDQQATEPRLSRWAAVGTDMLAVIVPSFIAALFLDLLFIPAKNTLRRRRPPNAARRLGTLLAIVGLKLLPVLIFIGASLTLLDQNETQKFPRFIILNVVYALTLSRIASAFIRALFAPSAEALRLLPASNKQAQYGSLWLSIFSFVIIYGYFFVDVARGIHVPPTVISAFGNMLSLALVVMTLVVIVQKRAFVATLLRGNLSAAQPDLTLIQSLRLWFARHWHILAMMYLILGYLITALGVENGFALMLRGTILTLVIITIMRLSLHATDRWGVRDMTSSSALHHTILRGLLRLVIWATALLGVAASWGANVPALFATSFGQHVVGACFSIGTTVAIVALIYGACNSFVDGKLNRRDSEGKQIMASARVRTLLPMLRNTIFILFSVVVALVALSEVGFNIAPLLAGAGIFGVAIGFGSQTLVKDFLTGLFIVVENTIAIGDVVQIGDHKGVVDAMSIRTLRLRDGDGALHILPYSEVTKIINMTKDYAFAVINVGVAYDSDLDKVMSLIRAVGEEMQKDPLFKRVILEPVEVLGVDNLGESSITIASRLRTRPGKQWDVRRMFLLKLVQRFNKEGIEIPFPTVTNLQKPHPSA